MISLVPSLLTMCSGIRQSYSNYARPLRLSSETAINAGVPKGIRTPVLTVKG
jgi:hypothetical protein